VSDRGSTIDLIFLDNLLPEFWRVGVLKQKSGLQGRLFYRVNSCLAADPAIGEALLVIAVTLFFIVFIIRISPVSGNAAADAALLVFGNISFAHVGPPDPH
jgi:hypothetical protein